MNKELAREFVEKRVRVKGVRIYAYGDEFIAYVPIVGKEGYSATVEDRLTKGGAIIHDATIWENSVRVRFSMPTA